MNPTTNSPRPFHGLARFCLFLLCGFLPARAAVDPTLGQLLHAVSARYASSADYSLHVHIKTGSSSSDYTLAAARPHQFMLRQTSKSSGRFEILLIADARTAWGYQPNRRLYTQSGPEPGEERRELARVHHQFFGRFQLLDRLAAYAHLTGYAMLSVGSRKIRCLLLRLDPAGGTGTDELWIDPEQHLVRKLVARRKRPMPETGEVVTTILWRECDIDRPVDPTLFHFQPPPGAHRTNTLEYR